MRGRLLMQNGESLDPVYLVVGANGDVGVKTYEYLWNTYGSTHVYPALEEIYISSGFSSSATMTTNMFVNSNASGAKIYYNKNYDVSRLTNVMGSNWSLIPYNY